MSLAAKIYQKRVLFYSYFLLYFLFSVAGTWHFIDLATMVGCNIFHHIAIKGYI